MQARELHSFTGERIFFVLVVCRERVLMENEHVRAFSAFVGEFRQQLLNLCD